MGKRWILLAVAAWPTLCDARTPSWSVSETSGAVAVLHTGLSKVATRGLAVLPGDVVRTGAGGRAVLVRGQEYMMIAPQSQIRLPDDAAKGAMTQLFEEAGSVVFMIKKMATPHFAVQTPYLAAVVKGTTFSVSVDAAGASVRVLEGAVDVATLDGGAHQMVLPGGSANVGAGSTDMLRTMAGGRETIVRSRSAAPPASTSRVIPRLEVSAAALDPVSTVAVTIAEVPVSLTTVTGGLVRDASSTVLADASSSLKQLATTQTAAREAQVTIRQAIADQQAADAAAAAAKADADAKAMAAASAAKIFAEQTAQAAAAQAAADAAAKQAADQAAAQLAASQAQATQQAAADAAARQAAADAAAASKAASDQAAAAAAATAKAAADQAALAAGKLAATQAAAQQAAATAATAQASASKATTVATTAGKDSGGLAALIEAILGAVSGKDDGRGNGGVGQGIGIGNGRH